MATKKPILFTIPSKILFVLLFLSCVTSTVYASTKMSNDRKNPWFPRFIGLFFLCWVLLIAMLIVLFERTQL